MNLQEQIGALEASVDDLILAAAAVAAAAAPADRAATAATAAAAQPESPNEQPPVEAASDSAGRDGAPEHATDAGEPAAPGAQLTPDAKPALHVERPSQNEIALSINGQKVSLHPLQLGQLIEELSNARASMQPEAPTNLPPGWRFVSTKNPMMAVQKQSNGDRLLVMRHTGHGWVPFTFSPDMVVQLYMMLTQR
jgi:hypothetical protein